MTDERAEYLVEHYADLILRTGKTWLGDMDDAKDICQTVLIKLLENPREFPDPVQERAWVIRVAVNECKNWRKTAWFRRRVPLDESLRLAAEDPEPEQQDPAPAPEDTDPAPAGERPLPYKGTVAVSLAVLHKAVGVGTADMLKVVGTLRQGTEVTVTGRNGPFAQLKNGLWMKESFLEA